MKTKTLKTKTALWISSFISLVSLFVVFHAIESEVAWKIIASSIGFSGFLGSHVKVREKDLKR